MQSTNAALQSKTCRVELSPTLLEQPRTCATCAICTTCATCASNLPNSHALLRAPCLLPPGNPATWPCGGGRQGRQLVHFFLWTRVKKCNAGDLAKLLPGHWPLLTWLGYKVQVVRTYLGVQEIYILISTYSRFWLSHCIGLLFNIKGNSL